MLNQNRIVDKTRTERGRKNKAIEKFQHTFSRHKITSSVSNETVFYDLLLPKFQEPTVANGNLSSFQLTSLYIYVLAKFGKIKISKYYVLIESAFACEFTKTVFDLAAQ